MVRGSRGRSSPRSSEGGEEARGPWATACRATPLAWDLGPGGPANWLCPPSGPRSPHD